MDILSIFSMFGSAIWTILAFIVALSIIVAVHEYGHYIVGRWSGIHADVFSIGFGPVLWSRHDKRGTRWQIAALPFGGYVKFAGDANAASGKDEAAMEAAAADPAALRRTMHGAPLWARSATVAAGPVFNFIMSALIFTFLAMNGGKARDPLTVGELVPLPVENRGLQPGDILRAIDGQPVPSLDSEEYRTLGDSLTVAPKLTYLVTRDGRDIEVQDSYLMPPVINGVMAKSAAIEAGLQTGDVITAINDTPVFAFTQLKDAVESSDGEPLSLTVWRAGETLEVTLAPKRRDEPDGEGGFRTEWRIGVASGLAIEAATETLGPVAAVQHGVARVWDVITGSISGLYHIIAGKIHSCNLSGAVGIAQVSGQMASQGILAFVATIGMLSTAVGFLNLLPIPMLDGGHLVFYAYEKVFGRPPRDDVARMLMMVGLTMVLSLMVFGLFNDFRCP